MPSCRSRTADDKLNVMLRNDTSTVGYIGVQLMKGKIIVLDNKVDSTRHMVVKNKYVLATSTTVTIRPCSRGVRLRDRNLNNND